MSDAIEMKDGDIFHWRWRDGYFKEPYSHTNAYWCKSQIAVFENGVLRDTFWGTSSDGALNPANVILEFKGNANQMQQIPRYEKIFYRPDDVVDMNHSNNSGAPVYVKHGASRNQDIMREYFKEEIARAKLDIAWSHRRIDECEKCLAEIEQGRISGHYPIYSRGRTP